ncbi:hypothetical protein ACNEP5_27975, partial [Escherichia coli]
NPSAAHGHAAEKFCSYKTFTGRGAVDLQEWTFSGPEDAKIKRILLIVLLCSVGNFHILPAVSTIERLCADAPGRR